MNRCGNKIEFKARFLAASSRGNFMTRFVDADPAEARASNKPPVIPSSGFHWRGSLFAAVSAQNYKTLCGIPANASVDPTLDQPPNPKVKTKDLNRRWGKRKMQVD